MERWSPYVSSYDNPVKFYDFLVDDPIKKYGIITGGGYSMTKSTDPGSSLKFGGQYALGLANEGIEAVNRYLSPLVPGAELATGKGYESSFNDDKSGLESGVELAAVFIPRGKAEVSAAKVAQKAVAGFLIHVVEAGGKEPIKAAIGSAKPIVSITAAKEFLQKGSKEALRSFMPEIGATIGGRGAFKAQVEVLQ